MLEITGEHISSSYFLSKVFILGLINPTSTTINVMCSPEKLQVFQTWFEDIAESYTCL